VADRDSRAQHLMNVIDVLKEEGISRIAIAGEKNERSAEKGEVIYPCGGSTPLLKAHPPLFARNSSAGGGGDKPPHFGAKASKPT